MDNPDLPIEFIKDVLLSKLQDKSLAGPFDFEEKVSDMQAFKKTYKKLPFSQQLIVNDAIKEIVKNPQIGNEKRGDLSGIIGIRRA